MLHNFNFPSSSLNTPWTTPNNDFQCEFVVFLRQMILIDDLFHTFVGLFQGGSTYARLFQAVHTRMAIEG